MIHSCGGACGKKIALVLRGVISIGVNVVCWYVCFAGNIKVTTSGSSTATSLVTAIIPRSWSHLQTQSHITYVVHMLKFVLYTYTNMTGTGLYPALVYSSLGLHATSSADLFWLHAGFIERLDGPLDTLGDPFRLRLTNTN